MTANPRADLGYVGERPLQNLRLSAAKGGTSKTDGSPASIGFRSGDGAQRNCRGAGRSLLGGGGGGQDNGIAHVACVYPADHYEAGAACGHDLEGRGFPSVEQRAKIHQ